MNGMRSGSPDLQPSPVGGGGNASSVATGMASNTNSFFYFGCRKRIGMTESLLRRGITLDKSWCSRRSVCCKKMLNVKKQRVKKLSDWAYLCVCKAMQLAGLGSAAGVSAPAGAGSNQSVQIPQALQNLQRILQSQLAQVSPAQIQQAIQRQQVNNKY